MHKVCDQIKKAVVAVAVVVMFVPVLVYGQARVEERTFHDIQQAYQRGEIDVDRAVLEQFRMVDKPLNVDNSKPVIEKCMTPAFMFLHRHRDEISEETRNKVEKYGAENAVSQKMRAGQSYISPSGKFQIIYETSGSNAVSLDDIDNNGIPDYVEYVAQSADSSYRHEVLNIGYPDPIPAGAQYRVFIENTGGTYGYTATQGSSPGGTYIVVNNNFNGFPSNTHPEGKTVGAIYATMAHEFKHAIQYKQNNWSGSADLWAEMDATLMEEVVYDDVNDYYNYINSFSTDLFSSASTSLIPGSYEDITWALFFEEYIGPDFWVNAWERIEAQPSIGFLEAVELELNTRGYNFEEEVVRSYMWHFVSGQLSGGDGYGFEEKEDYPTPRLDESHSFVPNDEVVIANLDQMSARYFEINPSPSDDGFVEIAVDFDSSQVGIGLIAFMKTGETKEIISTGRAKAQVYVPTTITWHEIDRLGIVVANFDVRNKTNNLSLIAGKTGQTVTIRDPNFTDLPEKFAVYQNYPNPFNPETNITYDLHKTAYVRLDIFDIMGRKVSTLVDEYKRLGTYTETFSGDRLSSGVYLYRLRIGREVFIKKMTLVK